MSSSISSRKPTTSSCSSLYSTNYLYRYIYEYSFTIVHAITVFTSPSLNVCIYCDKGFSEHAIKKKQCMPALGFEKIYRMLDKAARTVKKKEAQGKHFDIILNSDEVCMRYCPEANNYILVKGSERLVCNEKIDEQTKDTFSLMFTCGILRDSETNALKGFYSLPGFMFSGTEHGHLDIRAYKEMHDPQKGASTPFIGFNHSHYFNADRFSSFIDFFNLSERQKTNIMVY